MSELLEHIQVDTGADPQTSIIWMHGLGADANDFVPFVRELDLAGLPAIRFIFPNARTMPITINNGYVMRAWYDISNADLTRREDETGLRASQVDVEAFIAREKARGVPASRIILAGFSQGCAMTIQAGLRHPETLGGLLCLSGYAPLADKLAAERSDASLATPVFMAHGQYDNVVPLARAEASRALLQSLGCKVEWHAYPMQHTLCLEEVQDISAWLKKVVN